MGKKSSWFSIIKRFFTCHSGEDNSRNERRGDGKGESTSFIPIFRKPSSIEKIFSEFEREQQVVAFRPPTPELLSTPLPIPPPRPPSPQDPSSSRAPPPKEQCLKISPPRVSSPPRACTSSVVHHHEKISNIPTVVNQHEEVSDIPTVVNHHEKIRNIPTVVNHREEVSYVPEPTTNHVSSAIKIQATYRGYVARKSFRRLKSLVRLQGIVRGNSVRRQTLIAKKQMQTLVRVQSQIQSRRIEMLENQRQILDLPDDKEVHSTFDASEGGNQEDWDESSLTKEEKDARSQRKVEAAIKRERARSYAYSQSHQRTTRLGQDAQIDTCSMGVPRWLKWLEGQLPTEAPPKHPLPRSLTSTPQPEQKHPLPRPLTSTPQPEQKHPLPGPSTPTPQPEQKHPLPGPSTPTPQLEQKHPLPGPSTPTPQLEQKHPLPGPSTPTPQLEQKHPLPGPSTPTPQPEQKSSLPSPSSNNIRHNFGLDGRDTPTPKSTKSTAFSNAKPLRSPHRLRTSPTARSNISSNSRSRGKRPLSPFDMRLKDDDSLVSCPPYMAPHYMTPTISAKAKVRAHSNPRERFPGTPRSEASSRRQSFPPAQGLGMFRNRGLMSSPGDHTTLDDNQSLRSVGFSVASMPTGNRRKPFNRFV